jgi:hypothetical protein
MISQEIFMSNNEAALSSIRTATSHSHSAPQRASKAFYDRVRSDFLRQSANYLRSSLCRSGAVSFSADNNLVHP